MTFWIRGVKAFMEGSDLLWCCCRSEHERIQAPSPSTETARQGFETAPALPVPARYHLIAFHFTNKIVMFIPRSVKNTILTETHFCHKTKSDYLCNRAGWKVAPKLDLPCKLSGEGFGFKADNLYRKLSLQSVSLSHEVWPWNGNCLVTTQIKKLLLSKVGGPFARIPHSKEHTLVLLTARANRLSIRLVTLGFYMWKPAVNPFYSCLLSFKIAEVWSLKVTMASARNQSTNALLRSWAVILHQSRSVMTFGGQKASKHTWESASVTARWLSQGTPPWGFLDTSGKDLSASATEMKMNSSVWALAWASTGLPLLCRMGVGSRVHWVLYIYTENRYRQK